MSGWNNSFAALAGIITFGAFTMVPVARAAEVAGAETMLQSASASELLQVTATVGYIFTVGDTDLLATGLGVFDYEGNGFANGDVAVGLWESDGTSLAALAVTGAETLYNTAAYDDGVGSGFRYVLLETPILLSANTSYRVGARYETGNFVYYNVSGESSVDGVTYGDTRWSSSQTALAFPNGNPPPYAFTMIAADVLVTAVPEPGSGMLLLTAAGMVASGLRRRRG